MAKEPYTVKRWDDYRAVRDESNENRKKVERLSHEINDLQIKYTSIVTELYHGEYEHDQGLIKRIEILEEYKLANKDGE